MYSCTLSPWFTLTDLSVCLPNSISPRLSFSVENCPWVSEEGQAVSYFPRMPCTCLLYIWSSAPWGTRVCLFLCDWLKSGVCLLAFRRHLPHNACQMQDRKHPQDEVFREALHFNNQLAQSAFVKDLEKENDCLKHDHETVTSMHMMSSMQSFSWWTKLRAPVNTIFGGLCRIRKPYFRADWLTYIYITISSAGIVNPLGLDTINSETCYYVWQWFKTGVNS